MTGWPRELLRAMRPGQWTKNGVVLAAFFFALGDRGQGAIAALWGRALLAAGLFCVISSGIYLFNDVRDVAADRAHPVKRNRPIAAGRLPVRIAAWVAALLIAGGLLAAWSFDAAFAAAAGAYVALQLVYSLGLKHVPFLDIMMIAAGFVLRALAGGLALHVTISPWLLLCAFLLALFLALCKRRHEKLASAGGESASRPSLEHYDERVLDQLIAVSSAATLVAYAMYTMSPATVDKFGTHALGFTIPFVIFGLFRYMDLAYRHEKGERPEKVLLTDVPLIVDLLLYVLTVALIFAFFRG